MLLRNDEAKGKIGMAWRDLKKLPWASDTTPHAKVALGGKITKWPAEEPPPPAPSPVKPTGHKPRKK
jgi:hypothetical protein